MLGISSTRKSLIGPRESCSCRMSRIAPLFNDYQTHFATFSVIIKVLEHAKQMQTNMNISKENITIDIADVSDDSPPKEEITFDMQYSQCSDFWPQKPAMASFFENGITESFHECVSIFMQLLFHIYCLQQYYCIL